MLPDARTAGLHPFQADKPLGGLPVLPEGRAGSGTLSLASVSTIEAGQADAIMGSPGASLCSGPGDDVPTDMEEELSRALTAEFLEEVGPLSTAVSGAFDHAHLPTPRSHASSANPSRKPSGVLDDGLALGSPTAAAAGRDMSGAAGPAAAAGLQEEGQPSLYDQVGGGVVMKRLVDGFYKRVLGDPALAPFFEGVEMSRHARKFLLFITFVMGGPDEYVAHMSPNVWPQLYHAHERLIRDKGLRESHFDLVKGHFHESLLAVGAGQAQIDQALAIVESTRRAIFPVGPPPALDPSAPPLRCPHSGAVATHAAAADGGLPSPAQAGQQQQQEREQQQRRCPVAHRFGGPQA